MADPLAPCLPVGQAGEKLERRETDDVAPVSVGKMHEDGHGQSEQAGEEDRSEQ